MLKDVNYSYQDIVNQTGLSMTHIYNINTGNRRKRDGLVYPIRPSNTVGTKGIKFTAEENFKIHKMIIETNKEFKEIAKIFNCRPETISKINRGLTKAYRIEQYNYPLRKSK